MKPLFDDGTYFKNVSGLGLVHQKLRPSEVYKVQISITSIAQPPLLHV